MRKILILLTDPVRVYYEKGEVKDRYYNPCDLFGEVHMVSFCKRDIEEEKVRSIAGNGKLFIHPAGRLSALNLLGKAAAVSKLIDRIKPDILRAYDPSLRGALAVWLGKKHKVPSLVSLHTEFDDQRKFDKRPELLLRKIFELYAVRNADCIMAVTGHVSSYANRYGARRVELLYNRVSLDKFDEIRPGGVFKNRTVFSVGRFERPKRQDCLIKAMKGLDMDLALAGDGFLRPSMEMLAGESGVGKRAIFLGPIPHGDIQKYYLSCDIFAIATDFEGFCIPVIEAMAAAKPIVASDIPAIRELVGDAGILVNNDPDSFRAAISGLINDPERAKHLGLKARARAGMFDSSVLEKKEKSIYESLYRI